MKQVFIMKTIFVGRGINRKTNSKIVFRVPLSMTNAGLEGLVRNIEIHSLIDNAGYDVNKISSINADPLDKEDVVCSAEILSYQVAFEKLVASGKIVGGESMTPQQKEMVVVFGPNFKDGEEARNVFNCVKKAGGKPIG
jgi:hypothetical protein